MKILGRDCGCAKRKARLKAAARRVEARASQVLRPARCSCGMALVTTENGPACPRCS